ncbi:MAG: DNA polymerase IV [Xanthomonadales bacterium]|nr:DNA polymerase IV [Gammaproteobacteria bacterium]NNK05456.1 DNA polymerase IV [Xanthomonadales bacterium]
MTPIATSEPDTGRQRAIIHVDMDAFYASVEQNDNPQYRNRPVIVGGTGNRGVVAAASYEVRQFGVFSAMPISRARRLCPQAVILPVRMARYREISAQVFNVFRELTPEVEGLSLDEAFLDVTGSLALFGSIETIGASLREKILKRTGLHASVGMAHNKYLAKLASDAGKPKGFVHVPRDGVRAFLDPMPVSRIWGIGKRTLPGIRKLGILTIGQLRKADPAILAPVLGKRTGHFLALARGEDEREVVASRGDKSLSREVTFAQDIVKSRELFAELQRQAESVSGRLRAHGLRARTIQIKVRDTRFRTVTRSHSLKAPTASTEVVFKHARNLLATWLQKHINTPVRLLGLGVSGLEKRDMHGIEYDTAAQQALDRTVDEIKRRYGDEKAIHALAMRSANKNGKQ